MKKKDNRTHEFLSRLGFTILIVAIYMVGRSLPLFCIDETYYGNNFQNAESLLINMVSGDSQRCTVMALGIMPAVTAMLIVQLGIAILSSDTKAQISPKKVDRLTVVFMLIISIAMAYSRSNSLIFRETNIDIRLVKLIVILEMIAGASLIYYLTEKNKKHGIGAQSAIILVNILDGLKYSFIGQETRNLMIIGAICFVLVIITLIMELVMKKIPVQRVSINSIFSDENYIAFKLNPIGVMPVMFATSVFMLPQLIVDLLVTKYPTNAKLLSIQSNLVLTQPLGIKVYLAIVFILTLVFSFIMLNPGEIADNLQRMGDSIVNVYAGRETKRYIVSTLLILSVISGIVLAGSMSISLTLAYKQILPFNLAMLPATAMILTGLICSIVMEAISYIRYDSYKFFI